MLSTIHGCKADMRPPPWLRVAAFNNLPMKKKNPGAQVLNHLKFSWCPALEIEHNCGTAPRLSANIFGHVFFVHKSLYLLSFSLVQIYSFAHRVILKTLQFWVESLGVMLQFKYLHLQKKMFFFLLWLQINYCCYC